MPYRPLLTAFTRVSLLFLLLLAGSSSVWASRQPLGEAEINRELLHLEEGELPQQVFQSRVAALATHSAAYTPVIQGRIARLQCWAMKADRDSDYLAAIAFADREIALARQHEDLATEAGLLTCRSYYLQLMGKMEEARKGFDRALVQIRQLGDRLLEAQLLNYRGDMLAYQGGLAEGVMDLISSQRIYDELGLVDKGLQAFMTVANTYRRMGLYDRAEGYFQGLEREYQARGDHEKLIEVYARQSLLYGDMGEYAKALPPMVEAERYYEAQQWVMDLAWSRIEIASILVHLGQIDAAMDKLDQAKSSLFDQSSTDQATLGQWWLVMGQLLEVTGQPAQALDALAKAEPIFVNEQNPRFLVPLYQTQAKILELQGQTAAALQSLKRYVKTKQAMDTMQWQQRSLQMRFEFDLARKERENQQLKNQQLLQDQQLKQMRELRYWQSLVAGLLVLLLITLTLYLLARARKLQTLSITDELTGIDNRRRIQGKALEWFAQSRVEGKPFSVLMLDIDHFKQVNDQWGHHTGDMVLIAVARCISLQLRSFDRVGRNGGEEFLVLLPDTDLDEAADVAERIRLQVSLLAIDGLPAGRAVHVSVGCAQAQLQDNHLSDLIHRADQAMYGAKRGGRNQVARAE